MIKVNVKKKENSISEITITGHAYYDESGKDIVCASTSSIAITMVNAILRVNSQAFRYEEAGRRRLGTQHQAGKAHGRKTADRSMGYSGRCYQRASRYVKPCTYTA